MRTADKHSGNVAATQDRQVFRSPAAAAVWWVWLLFAVGNLIDLAVQGRDHLSVVAAGTLLVITGVVYIAAFRPKVVADDDGLTIVNPVRDHRVGWAAVSGFDTTDLLRVRCAWPATAQAAGQTDGEERKRAIYSWAVHSSRRKALSAEMRERRLGRRGLGGGRGMYRGYATPPRPDVPPPAPLGLDADTVVAALTARSEKARAQAPDATATPPASAWDWTAVAAVVLPALLLLIVVLV